MPSAPGFNSLWQIHEELLNCSSKRPRPFAAFGLRRKMWSDADQQKSEWWESTPWPRATQRRSGSWTSSLTPLIGETRCDGCYGNAAAAIWCGVSAGCCGNSGGWDDADERDRETDQSFFTVQIRLTGRRRQLFVSGNLTGSGSAADDHVILLQVLRDVSCWWVLVQLFLHPPPPPHKLKWAGSTNHLKTTERIKPGDVTWSLFCRTMSQREMSVTHTHV